MNLEASLHSLLSFAWTLTCPKNLICCVKILFSHTQRGYQFLFIDYFIIFRFFFCYFTLLLIFTKIILLVLFYYIFFFIKIIFIFSCSGMFRNVPACSGMFHVPGFIDAQEFVPWLKSGGDEIANQTHILRLRFEQVVCFFDIQPVSFTIW